MEALTNSELIEIITCRGACASHGNVSHSLVEAANAELLRRIQMHIPKSNKVDSLFDVAAIQAEAEKMAGILDSVKNRVPKWSDYAMKSFAGYHYEFHCGRSVGIVFEEWTKKLNAQNH